MLGTEASGSREKINIFQIVFSEYKLFLYLQANPLFDFDSEEEIEPMIVNGRAPTDIDPTAHAVVLFATRKTDQTTGQLGGGSIIGPRAVLTAAHLVRK